MKVYRGPATTNFQGDSHALVAKVKPEKLEEGVRSKSLIRFNISKEGNDRQAVCTVQFEDADIVPMMRGLLARLTANQELFTEIADCLSKESSSDHKVSVIRLALQKRG